jgi:hypothetical protein
MAFRLILFSPVEHCITVSITISAVIAYTIHVSIMHLADVLDYYSMLDGKTLLSLARYADDRSGNNDRSDKTWLSSQRRPGRLILLLHLHSLSRNRRWEVHAIPFCFVSLDSYSCCVYASAFIRFWPPKQSIRFPLSCRARYPYTQFRGNRIESQSIHVPECPSPSPVPKNRPKSRFPCYHFP